MGLKAKSFKHKENPCMVVVVVVYSHHETEQMEAEVFEARLLLRVGIAQAVS